jgi:hypothetical protein
LLYGTDIAICTVGQGLAIAGHQLSLIFLQQLTIYRFNFILDKIHTAGEENGT